MQMVLCFIFVSFNTQFCLLQTPQQEIKNNFKFNQKGEIKYKLVMTKNELFCAKQSNNIK